MSEKACPGCTLYHRDEFCPMDGGPPKMPCGFQKKEITRRKKLPLVWDGVTHTRRKYVRQKPMNE